MPRGILDLGNPTILSRLTGMEVCPGLVPVNLRGTSGAVGRKCCSPA
ncbi:MAG: hypothetical protein CM1200mP15_19420 [Dehalococcoidia bacterium]|nr:MAG: hypothetical protein CM1200mP15_19420 [Dehalococcoidia bacterium]